MTAWVPPLLVSSYLFVMTGYCHLAARAAAARFPVPERRGDWVHRDGTTCSHRVLCRGAQPVRYVERTVIPAHRHTCRYTDGPASRCRICHRLPPEPAPF